MTCPCCGQPVSAHRLLVDLNTNCAVHNGKNVEVRGPQVAVLVYVLAKAYPATVSAIWGMHEPDSVNGSIRAHACQARRALKPTGFCVEGIGGRGYRLVAPDQPLATAWAMEQRAAS